jgi:selenocysteine lyase/cysteine desulfurase
MSDASNSRRRFLQQCLAGAAVAAAGPTACSRPSRGSDAAPRFAEAWESAAADGRRWRIVRDQFLLEPGYAYLNTGGLGPTPRPVIDAFDQARLELERRCETGHGLRAGVRRGACEFLGCREEELAFTRSATEGMNLVARGLELRAGDEVVMTTHEHPGGAMPWFAVREDTPIRIRTFEPGSGGDDTLGRLRAALTARTRIVMVSHVTCTTGLVMPVREIVDECRPRGIVCVIDGAQAVGQIPVDLEALGSDFYVTSGHKWLLGPKGTGVLYVRDEYLDVWKPPFIGAYSDARFDLAEGVFTRLRPASASEYGTRSTPLVIGLGAALDFLSTIGMEETAMRGAFLARRLRDGLSMLRGVELLTPSAASAAILTFRLPVAGGDPWEWCDRLRREHGFRLRPVGEAGLAAVRASTHVFNSEDEVDRLIDVIRKQL